MRLSIHSMVATVIALVLTAGSASAHVTSRYAHRGHNELSSGIGFAAGVSDYAPGGFEWFNEYGHWLRGPVWLNVQLNLTVGDDGYCHVHGRDYHCHGGHWDGSAMEIGVGAKFKWWVRNSPVQLHAKVGPAVEMVWYDDYYDGTALAIRGGFGVRYFILPSLAIGGEVAAAAGPMFTDFGTEAFSTVDANFGVEFRF